MAIFSQNMTEFRVELLQFIFLSIWCSFQIDGERDIDTVFADVSDAITPILVKSAANERILNKYLFCLFSFLFYIFIFSA